MNILGVPKIVINLDEREDRLSEFKQEFPKLFGKKNFIRMPANKATDVREAIISSHKKALQWGQDLFWFVPENPWLLIMEDDLVLSSSESLQHYVSEALKNAPEDADILLGGVYGGVRTTHNTYWSRVEHFAGAHFVLYNARIIDKVLSHDFGPVHYDRALSGIAKCYVTNKMFATQRAGFSDNRKAYVDDSHYLAGFELL